jgi:hypothetical protein
MSVREFLEDQMRTAAHGAPPDYTRVGSSEGRPPTLLVHSGLNFVGRAGKVNNTAWKTCQILANRSHSLYICAVIIAFGAQHKHHMHACTLGNYLHISQEVQPWNEDMKANGKRNNSQPWMTHQNIAKQSTTMKTIRNILQQLSDYHFFLEQPVL